MSVLEVKNLKKYYGNVKAVDGVSFTMEQGQIVALLGPNGAGKTTTIEIIEGLRKKDEGEIFYFGRKVEFIDREIKRMLGVQLQKSAFLDNLTVKETLELFAGLYGISLKASQLGELVEMFMLQEKMNSRVKALSGGQMQRLALAVALVNDPKIVFLDEPTTGLDPQARRHVWQIVRGLVEKGKTVLLTTHYMEEAEELADYVLIMDHGKIIAEGTVDDLIKMLNMDSYLEFVVEKPEVFLERMPGARMLNDEKITVPTKKVEDDVQKIFVLAKNEGLSVENLVVRRPNLEDVFLSLTGRHLRD
ncbi:MAG: type transport system ATP-binding protein [Pseudothermotoga sp.]|nr:type transport system ATP-binding protein [Pseudothermotoga sp.]